MRVVILHVLTSAFSKSPVPTPQKMSPFARPSTSKTWTEFTPRIVRAAEDSILVLGAHHVDVVEVQKFSRRCTCVLITIDHLVGEQRCIV